MAFNKQLKKLLGRKTALDPNENSLPTEFVRSNLDGLLESRDFGAASKSRDMWLRALGPAAGAWSEPIPTLPLLEINRLPSFPSLKKNFFQNFVADQLKQRWWRRPSSTANQHPPLGWVASLTRACALVIRSRLDDSGRAAELMHALKQYVLELQEQLSSGIFHPEADITPYTHETDWITTTRILDSVATVRALIDVYAETKDKAIMTALECAQTWARLQNLSSNWIANSSFASIIGEVGALQRDTRTVSESVEEWKNSVMLGQITADERKGCWFGLHPYTPLQHYLLLGDALALLAAACRLQIPPARMDPLLVGIVSGFQPILPLLKSHGAGELDQSFPVFCNAIRWLPRSLLNQIDSTETFHIVAAQTIQVATTVEAPMLQPYTLALILEDLALEHRIEELIKR